MRDVDLVMTDDVRTERPYALHLEAKRCTAPQRGRKKAHWRIPPKTRVRVRQRIRRWDGIMYNIDLFPYVEHRLLAFIS